jgi:hypothetical protein
MRAIPAALVVLGGCGFDPGTGGTGDGPPPGDGNGGDGDVVIDGPPPIGCFDRWLAGPTLTPPVPVLNAAVSESDPFLSDDELTIYVSSGGDIRTASRAAIGDPFPPATIETSLSARAFNDYKASITGDGLTAFVSTRRGGTGVTEIYRGTRGSSSDAFVLDTMYVAAINTGVDQWDAHISRDGLRLYLSPGNGAAQHPTVAVRASDASPFAASQTIAEIASSARDNDHTLSADERVIVFASDRTGSRQLHYAVRDTPDGTFSNPALLPGVQTDDDAPHLSSDGCRLYFVSDRDGSNDIFVATVM